MNWWLGEARQPVCEADLESEASLRRCTYAGRPFGSETFVSEMSEQFGRYWTRGRPKKERAARKPR